jgi:hypothetical protein
MHAKVLTTQKPAHLTSIKMIASKYVKLEVLSSLSNNSNWYTCINPLNTKRRLLYLKTQFVPRSKYFSSRFKNLFLLYREIISVFFR